jgi:ribonuclease P protein component
MAKRFTLGKNERLKSRKAIEQLFRQGKSFVVTPFKLFFVITPGLKDPNNFLQFGVGVSSKNFKRAVDRNRVKRLTREAYRLQKGDLKNSLKSAGRTLHLFLIYTGRELPNYQLVSDKVGVILKKLQKQIDENNSSNP